MDLECSGSGIIHWKWDSPVKSSIEDRARGWRRSDFEKNIIRAYACRLAIYSEEIGKLTYVF